ncbi:MAG: hypothetical protein OEW48_03005 [Phycisphaerae bacterium]|nr:hypothetical protein [Phycisphaerae bacterium]
MKKLLFTSLFLLISTNIVLADWNEGDPAKYIQRPDLTGNGMAAFTPPPNIGGCGPWREDFKCTQTGPITSIHIWGVWLKDELPVDAGGNAGPENIKFDVNIWNLAEGWAATIDKSQFTVREVTYVKDGKWWDYYGQQDPPGWTVYQYNMNLEVPGIEPIIQRGTQADPQTYYLQINPKPDPSPQSVSFGWLVRDPADGHYGIIPDMKTDAFFPPYPDCLGIRNLEYPSSHPYAGMPTDLSFVINTETDLRSLKWSQPPVETNLLLETPVFCGWDEQSNGPRPQVPRWKVVADDYRCIGDMPVTGIHWWGSHYGWNGDPKIPPTQPIGWRIGFWNNIPADPCAVTFSRPERLLWLLEIDAARVADEEVGTDIFPRHPEDICFKYSLMLEEAEFFRQGLHLNKTTDDIFWVSIAAVYEDGDVLYPWGWKTRPWSWMDDAVTVNIDEDLHQDLIVNPGQITPLEYENESYDAAFALQTSGDSVKWRQAFTGLRNWPHYEDVNSWAKEDSDGNLEPNPPLMVADDWICRRRKPVTAIVWWGSYIDYTYEACQGKPVAPASIRPDYFLLRFWTDAQASPFGGYSHPNEPIWEYKAYDYDQVLVGYDKYPHEFPAEPVFRYSVKLPWDKWFYQKKIEGIYWISVVAVYVARDPEYEWGWTNHPHTFNDYAVKGWWKDTANWDWQIQKDQTGQGEDMSFVLFTNPDECTGCADYDLDSTVTSLDLKVFAVDWLWTGLPGGHSNGDLDCDGDADFDDYAILALQWLESCP